MTDFDVALRQVYRAQGLIELRDASVHPVHLPTACPKAGACWAGAAVNYQPKIDSPAAKLSAPYIGRRYAEGRLLIVMENLRHHGGYDAMRDLGDRARRELQAGKKVLFRDPKPGYPGTRVWYQAIAYATAWLGATGRLRVEWVGKGVPSRDSLIGALDLVAIVQHVKCSPTGGRSEQNKAMWSSCGTHVLVHEIDVLQPSSMLVVGTGDNANAVRERVLPQEGHAVAFAESVPTKRGAVALTMQSRKRLGSESEIATLTVPHPAWPGGTSKKLVDAARCLLERRYGNSGQR